MPKGFDVEHEMLKLLYWVRDHGFGPVRATASDEFLCPLTKRIYRYGELHDHQKQTVLWTPNKLTPKASDSVLKAWRIRPSSSGSTRAI